MKKRLGIVGGGQLGRMLAQAAKPLGFHVSILDPTPNGPAGRVADEHVVASFKDPDAIEKFAASVDFLTFEIELAHADVLKKLQDNGKLVNPTGETLSIIKDKYNQKVFLSERNIPVAPYKKVDSRKDLEEAIKIFEYPVVLKARFDAYDGRGNALIRDEGEIDAALEKLSDRELYVEAFVPFKKEIAVIAARSLDGDVVVYPTVETIHHNNICHTVITPAPISKDADEKAKQLAEKVLTAFEGAGVFGIEMFLTEDDEVLINEIAPRVHNSGHHSIESSATSQFEQHVRAVTGMPLGSTDLTVPAAVMVNILGDREGDAQIMSTDSLDTKPGVAVHIYDKIETRNERKMGHITAVADSRDEALRLAKEMRDNITI